MDDGSRRKNEIVYLQGDNEVKKVAVLFNLVFSLICLLGCTNKESYETQSVETEVQVVYATEVAEQTTIEIETEEVIEYSTYYVTAKNLYILDNPDLGSSIVGELLYGQDVNVHIDGEWAETEDENYISSQYLSDTPVEYISYEAPMTNGMKSYMPYGLFSSKSNQYKLQEMCYTGNYGIRQYNDRYCVAIGSHFGTSIGQYFDLVLENGVVIPCVMADQKADCHTDSDNIITVANGCMTEFVVDKSALHSDARVMGNISYCTEDWKSRVVEVRVYDKSAFSEY